MSVVLELSADFIAEQRIELDPVAVVVGVRRGFLRPTEAIAVARRAVASGSPDPFFGALAAASAADLPSVDELLGMVPVAQEDHDGTGVVLRIWLFLQLTAAYLLRSEMADPLGVVEEIYADFNYPESMEPFVRYMPLRAGEVAGPEAVMARWRRYLDDEARELAGR